MAGGFKRGGLRGGGSGSGSFKKVHAKKRSPEDADDAPRASKKSKGDDDEQDDASPVVPELQADDDNNPFIALNHSGKRRVTVSDFKGLTLVSIREYWVNDGGELKPGKKGISLSLDQYNALLAAAPLLESVLSKWGLEVARPNYEAEPNATEPAEEEKDEGQQPVETVDDDKDEE